MAGSKATHQTSPRWGGGLLSGAWIIGYVACQVLHPFRRLALAFLVGRHGAVCLRQLAPGHMRARKVVEEPAYPPPSNDGVKAVINIVPDRARSAVSSGPRAAGPACRIRPSSPHRYEFHFARRQERQSSHRPRRDVQLDPSPFLQIADDAEEVARMRIGLFAGVPVASPSFSKPTVALMWSRRIALPASTLPVFKGVEISGLRAAIP
jgi:hypothetical protein